MLPFYCNVKYTVKYHCSVISEQNTVKFHLIPNGLCYEMLSHFYKKHNLISTYHKFKVYLKTFLPPWLAGLLIPDFVGLRFPVFVSSLGYSGTGEHMPCSAQCNKNTFKSSVSFQKPDYPNKSTNLVVQELFSYWRKKRFKSYATLLPQFNSLEEQESWPVEMWTIQC